MHIILNMKNLPSLSKEPCPSCTAQRRTWKPRTKRWLRQRTGALCGGRRTCTLQVGIRRLLLSSCSRCSLRWTYWKACRRQRNGKDIPEKYSHMIFWYVFRESTFNGLKDRLEAQVTPKLLQTLQQSDSDPVSAIWQLLRCVGGECYWCEGKYSKRKFFICILFSSIFHFPTPPPTNYRMAWWEWGMHTTIACFAATTWLGFNSTSTYVSEQ